MIASELTKAKQPAEIEKLLDKVENLLTTDYQSTAYNFLIDYLENPDWFSSHEGQRLLMLCLEILHNI